MTPYNINNWYWKVGDQSPTTQVYSTASNSFVPLADTTYSNWLAAGNQATVIDTMANLYDVFNTHNLTSYVPTTQNYGTLGASLSVTNPLPATINVGFSATLCQVILPRMDTPNGIPIGRAFTIVNTGSQQFGVMVNGGVTNLASVQPNGLIILQLNANNSQGGTIQVLSGSTGGTSDITIGTTHINAGHSASYLYDAAGFVGEQTPAQLQASLNYFTSTLQGLAPPSGGGTVNFLRADGTWAAPTVGAAGLVIGTSTVSGGTTLRVLYDNAGVVGEYTNVQLTALIQPFTSALSGAAPASGGGTVNYLRADGTWASPAPAGAAFTASNDTNVTLATSGAPATALLNGMTLTAGWTGTLAATRLNANVVQSITNDTNINGSISAQNLTLSWAGILAAARGGTGSAFFNVAGPTALRTYTFPDASVSIAALNLANQTVTGGASVSSFNLGTASGTVTVNPGGCPIQYITNNAAFTLAAPTADGSMMLLVTNGASAGAITMSGFTVGANTGDAYDQVSGHKFTFSIWRANGTSGYRIAAHQ